MARGRIIHTIRPKPKKSKSKRRPRRRGPLTCARCGLEARHLVRRSGRYYCCAESACGKPEVWDRRNPSALSGTTATHCPACGVQLSRPRPSG